QVLDARGGLITPGLNDAHIHTQGGVLARDGVDLANCQTLEQIRSSIHAAMPASPQAWIVGRGWSYRAFEGRFPTKSDLDAIVGSRPASLTTVDGHATWVSSAALTAAGITAATPDPIRGTIVRLPGSTEPSGYLLEAAARLVRNVIPRPSVDELTEKLRPALR